MDDFIKISQLLGKNKIYVQGAGGNTSVKVHNKLYIKASGHLMKNVNIQAGYACLKYKPIKEFFADKKKYSLSDENKFLDFMSIQLLRDETYGLPSMEAGFHSVIPSKYVFHLHSLYANIFCCMKYGARTLGKLFRTEQHVIIDYINPGYELALYLSKMQNIPSMIFLKNHGIIVHGNTTNECLNTITNLHSTIENYLIKKGVFVAFKKNAATKTTNKYSFPDAAVYANVDIRAVAPHKQKEIFEITDAQNYITNTIKRLGKKPVYLNEKAVNKLLNMKQERERQEVVKIK